MAAAADVVDVAATAAARTGGWHVPTRKDVCMLGLVPCRNVLRSGVPPQKGCMEIRLY